MTGKARLLQTLIGLGTFAEPRPTDRLVRQVNGLNLFFGSVALGAALIVAALVPDSEALVLVQAGAAVLFFSGPLLTSRGLGALVRRLTLLVFEVQMFGIIVLTGGWSSPVLFVVTVYPLLAALAEVSRLRHWLVSLGQVAFFFALAGFPGSSVLSIMALVTFPLMAAVVIEIIFRENLRVRLQQKVLVAQISVSNHKLEVYSERLKDESLRLQTEVNIARRIQTLVLPRAAEVRQITDLEVACVMLTADEVGGDYYDVIEVGDTLTFGIGDVTGHGLVSGLIMLMVQTAVRTLAELGTDPGQTLAVVNRVLYANIRRLQEERDLTLMLVTYRAGHFVVSGQHESVMVLRLSGEVEVIDTLDLGFYVGLMPDISDKVRSLPLVLQPGELLILYTDGITEAEDRAGLAFGQEGIRATVLRYRDLPVEKLAQKFLQVITNHVGSRPILDDVSLVLVRQR